MTYDGTEYLDRRFFDDFMRDFPFYDDREMKRMEKKLYGRRGKNVMKTDIQETDKNYILEMDLPGFSKDEVKVSLENGYLTISAAKGLNKDEKEKRTADIFAESVMQEHASVPSTWEKAFPRKILMRNLSMAF